MVDPSQRRDVHSNGVSHLRREDFMNGTREGMLKGPSSSRVLVVN